jgi:hypothetical protein
MTQIWLLEILRFIESYMLELLGFLMTGQAGLSRVWTSTSASTGHPPDGMPSTIPPDRQHGGRHGERPSNRRSPAPTVGWMADGRSVHWSGSRSAGRTPRPGPSARGRPPGPSAQPKLWSPITIDLEIRFRRVIPFWNFQVMLYNIGY